MRSTAAIIALLSTAAVQAANIIVKVGANSSVSYCSSDRKSYFFNG